jgi:hypothetical protein
MIMVSSYSPGESKPGWLFGTCTDFRAAVNCGVGAEFAEAKTR